MYNVKVYTSFHDFLDLTFDYLPNIYDIARKLDCDHNIQSGSILLSDTALILPHLILSKHEHLYVIPYEEADNNLWEEKIVNTDLNYPDKFDEIFAPMTAYRCFDYFSKDG